MRSLRAREQGARPSASPPSSRRSPRTREDGGPSSHTTAPPVTALASSTRDERPPLDTRTVKAVAHPVRVRILAHLHEHGPASPNELAPIFFVTLGTMSYHVRRLQQLGFVELVRKTPRRGAIEHHYALAADAAVRLRGIADFVTHGDAGAR